MRPRPRPANAKPAAPIETTTDWGFLFIFMSPQPKLFLSMSPQLLHFYYRCQMSPQPATAARAQEARRQEGRLMRGRTPQALFSQSSPCMNPPYFLNSAYGINHPPRVWPSLGQKSASCNYNRTHNPHVCWCGDWLCYEI